MISHGHNYLYPEFQSAYRKLPSTDTTLLRVQNDILQAVDLGYEVILVLLDFTAAFDAIDHSILLTRLEQRFGISGKAWKWLASYLDCLLYTSPSPRDQRGSRMPSSA